ncbi:hypothetical protein Taro_023271 [Colocasia esculenta]|uniref:CCHC-type domain-containing protein n=1 Tax=Colocasia esculenta TaxID=4460 RepID=A0A843V7U7_COLES|nr:hypothetical protein [Colocasia esculenta]
MLDNSATSAGKFTAGPRHNLANSASATPSFSGTNISCKGSVDTTINGVDTMAQSKGRNVKKSSTNVDTRPGQVDTSRHWMALPEDLFRCLGQQVDTRSSQVDTRWLSQKASFAVWDSRSTPNDLRCNKPGHMKGECPENKKEKHKKIHKFKKPKAMVATWSDEDTSENEEEEKSSSSESEEICFMANNSDGKVSTSFEDFSVED